MAVQKTSYEEIPKRRRSVCSCIGCFVIWLFPICLALAVSLYFSPNERINDINEYNKRAAIWESEGIVSFNETSFTYCVNDDCFTPSLVKSASGELYPVGDSCDKEDDPKGGCLQTSVAYFSHSLKSVSGDLDVSLSNELGNVIANTTIHIPHSKTFLKKVCLRVRNSDNGYIVDIPPAWKLHNNEDEGGCEFGNGWEIAEFSKKPVESILFEVRSYQDPYIAASSLTHGCNENPANKGCFGITKKEMTTYGLYGIIAAGAITLVEVLILLSACCCCRDKLPCFGKDEYGLN